MFQSFRSIFTFFHAFHFVREWTQRIFFSSGIYWIKFIGIDRKSYNNFCMLIFIHFIPHSNYISSKKDASWIGNLIRKVFKFIWRLFSFFFFISISLLEETTDAQPTMQYIDVTNIHPLMISARVSGFKLFSLFTECVSSCFINAANFLKAEKEV